MFRIGSCLAVAINHKYALSSAKTSVAGRESTREGGAWAIRSLCDGGASTNIRPQLHYCYGTLTAPVDFPSCYTVVV